jgi:hypothetical protein
MMRLIALALIGFGLICAGFAMSASSTGTPNMLLAGIGGLSFAAGLVLFGVGMGRWNNPRRHEEPGDAIVNPASHDKMDHV